MAYTYLLDFKKMDPILSESELYTEDMINDLVLEKGGYFKEECCLVFNFKGIESYVVFDIYVSGTIDVSEGDYWTPSDCVVYSEINSIEIKEFYIDNITVKLNGDIENLLLEKVSEVIL